MCFLVITTTPYSNTILQSPSLAFEGMRAMCAVQCVSVTSKCPCGQDVLHDPAHKADTPKNCAQAKRPCPPCADVGTCVYPSVKVDCHHIPLKQGKHILYENLRLSGGDRLVTVVLFG